MTNANANSNNNSPAPIAKNTVNKSISVCLKDCRLFENKGTKVKDIDQIAYKNEKNYQNSFKKSPIADFEKSIPRKTKKKYQYVSITQIIRTVSFLRGASTNLLRNTDYVVATLSSSR